MSSEASKPLTEYLDVRITDQEKRNDDFVLFVVETRSDKSRLPASLLASLGSHILQTFRRYSDFYLLRQFLEMTYPSTLLPPLPDKFASYVPWKIASQKFNPDFLENRRLGLELFMFRLLRHPKMSQCEQVLQFLKEDNSWKDLIASQQFSQSLQGYLDMHSATFRLRKSLNHVTDLRRKANSLKSSMSALTRAYEKVIKRNFILHKLHGCYGNVFSEWCTLEDGASADAIQAVGHFMDVYSTSLDGTLGEDDEVLSYLRMYSHYGDVLLELCRRIELRVLHIEQTEDKLMSKQAEVQQVSSDSYGVSLRGLKTKLFGSPTNSQKSAMIAGLEHEANGLEQTLTSLQEDLKVFCAQVDTELEFFERQKKADLSLTMRRISVLQAEKLKRSQKVWSHCRDNFSKF